MYCSVTFSFTPCSYFERLTFQFLILTVFGLIIFSVPDINCVWSDWSDWSDCSVTCGTGTQDRDRKYAVEQSGNGAACSGDDTGSQTCSMADCSEFL